MSKVKDLTGQRFGRLVTIKQVKKVLETAHLGYVNVIVERKL